MSKKEFIRDDGEIRNCDSNVAKMNVLEYTYHKNFFLKDSYYMLSECFEYIGKGAIGLLGLLYNILFLALFPISFPTLSYLRIRNARKEVERYKRLFGE